MLGLSSPAEREHIESDFFEDDDAFQEMLTAEDDLIDAYARGELAGKERRTFEQRFVSSLGEKDRVQFARAFARINQSAKTRIPATLPDTFKIVQSPRLLRTAAVAAVIVFVAVLAWLVIDRSRMTNELHAESVELGKRVDAFQRSTDNERTRVTEIAVPPADLKAQPDKVRHREPATTVTQRATSSAGSIVRGTATDRNGNVVIGASEVAINTSDATLGNSFVNERITELPLNARNVVGLLTLQPGVSRTGSVNGGRTDQSNITLDGVDMNEPLNTYSLMLRDASSSGEITIRIPSSLSWIRFQITLETAATHDEYRVTIKAADGRPVTTVDWLKPVTPNQTIIDTPAISTVDLPAGDYVLVLMGKEADGSFVKVAEYSFKVTK